MKQVTLLLLLMSFASFAVHAKKYRHKTETEIAQMTPAQRVDEYAEEQINHKYDVLDDQSALINKYIRRDGLKAVPRIIEIIDEYDPTRSSGKRGHKGERFDAAWMIMGSLDNSVVRLRITEEGKRAISALERSIERLEATGYGRKDQDVWERSGRFNGATHVVESAKGVNFRDEFIRNTFKVEYEIILSDAELLEFSNFLAAKYPDYPIWSEAKLIKYKAQSDDAGYPVQLSVLTKPERFYEAYTEYKKTNPVTE